MPQRNVRHRQPARLHWQARRQSFLPSTQAQLKTHFQGLKKASNKEVSSDFQQYTSAFYRHINSDPLGSKTGDLTYTGMTTPNGFSDVTDKRQLNSSGQRLIQHPWACVSVIGFSGGGSLVFYTYTTLTTISLMTAIGQAQTPLQAGLLILLALCGVSLYTAISGIVKAELFPLETRALGVGFCYAIGNAVFGGSAEYAALSLKKMGYEQVYFYYVTAMAVVFLLVALRLPRPRMEIH